MSYFYWQNDDKANLSCNKASARLIDNAGKLVSFILMEKRHRTILPLSFKKLNNNFQKKVLRLKHYEKFVLMYQILEITNLIDWLDRVLRRNDNISAMY